MPHVRFPLRGCHVDVINIYQLYAPEGRGLKQQQTSEQKRELREQLWHDLAGVIEEVPFRHVLLLCGDFNASLSPCSSLIGPAVQKAPFRSSDDTLQKLVEAHQLCCLNTWMAPRHFSCQGPGGHKSVIDFVMIRDAQVDMQAGEVSYLYDSPLLSLAVAKHIPCIGSICKLWQCWKQSSPTRALRCNTEKFMHDAYTKSESYINYLQDLQQQLMGATEASKVDYIVRTVAFAHYPERGSVKAKVMDAQIRGLVHRGWRLWRQLRAIQGIIGSLSF